MGNYHKIGIIGAMVEEIERIEPMVEHAKVTERAGIRFLEGECLGKSVVLCKSGVGKVNAAVTTQILVDGYGVDAVVFTGVAGAVDPGLEVGDLVVSEDCMHHDMDVTALGFAKGIIPYQDISIFRADETLKRLAYEAGQTFFPGRTKLGRILSGDQFIADKELVAALREELSGTCTEMEGSAVAQVCAMNGIPFVIIRSMSDKADGSAHVSFAEFTRLAAEHSFTIVAEMLKKL